MTGMFVFFSVFTNVLTQVATVFQHIFSFDDFGCVTVGACWEEVEKEVFGL